MRVTKEAVVPAIEAARAAGLTIVQAPSPEVAAKFEQLQRHEPPAPFRAREGEYAAFKGRRHQPPGDCHALGGAPRQAGYVAGD